jgi:poly-beta-hydroxyalkanoate depolymerase
VIRENAIRERKTANDNLRELGSFLIMGESHDVIPVEDAKYTSALRSQMIETKKPNWMDYECTYFGQAPLNRYPKPEEINMKRTRYLQSINNSICKSLMDHINEKKAIPVDEKKEWMIELCKQSTPVLSYISKIEEFTNPFYPSLIFEAHSFEIPYESNTKLYVILVKSSNLEGLLVVDYFFYYF